MNDKQNSPQKFSNLKVIFSWFDRLAIYSGYFAASLAIIITLLVTFSVLMRYVFNNPVFWVDEISGYMFVVYVSIGIVYATLRESHISSEIIISNMPMKIQYGVAIIGYMIALIICCVMVFYGAQTTLLYITKGWKSDTILGVILWPVWLSIPVGFILFALAVVSRIRAVTVRFINTGSIEPPRNPSR